MDEWPLFEGVDVIKWINLINVTEGYVEKEGGLIDMDDLMLICASMVLDFWRMSRSERGGGEKYRRRRSLKEKGRKRKTE